MNSSLTNGSANAAGSDECEGFFAAVCKDPPRLETWVSNHLKHAGFTTTDRDHVKDAAIAGFKEKDYDGALHDAVARLSTAYAHVGGTHSIMVGPILEARDWQANRQ